MKRLSIGSRLSLWYLVIFAVAQAVFGAGMWLLLRYHLYDLADDDLENQVDDLKNFLQAQPRDGPLDALQQAMTNIYSREHAGEYLQIYAGNGRWVYRSGFLREHAVTAPEPEAIKGRSYEDHKFPHRPLRFITEKLELNGKAYTLQTAVLIDDVVGTLSSFRNYLLMFAPALLLVAVAGGYWLSRQALAPVDSIVATARQISGANLNRRLEKLQTGDELQRLSDTLNEMLERIERSFLRITQFTADASHELRTPISLVRTESELALRKARGEQEYRESLQHILMEAERTTSLIEQLLALARADSGREVLNLQTVDLRQILSNTAEPWKQIADIRGLRLREHLGDKEQFIEADENSMRRLANILLDNAFKYTPRAGAVDLQLAHENGKAVMIVCDTGIGIPVEEQTKIFERFYRVDRVRSRESGGAGLGLSIAQWIVQQHQGTIRVESSPGQGSTFRVELPLSRAAAPRVSQSAKA
ncbi:MAG TPA: ATP-binding protein [Candidatus Sulfotelmatobacter sp.]|nr:ATP-binding protein [Candidatus Sulfotelmatobacter sp.]